MDWNYRPLEGIDRQKTMGNRTAYGVQGELAFQAASWVRGRVNYLYRIAGTESRNYYKPESFVVRNNINSFATISADEVFSPVPYGAMLDQNREAVSSHYF